MAVITLYRSGTQMVTTTLHELGDISTWLDDPMGCAQMIPGGLDIIKGTNSFSVLPGPINKADFGGSDPLPLYANTDLTCGISLNFYVSSGNVSGYQRMAFVNTSTGLNLNLGVSYGDYWSFLSNAYFARATVNGHVRIGILVCNLKPADAGKAAFFSNSDWSDAFMSQAHIINTDNPYWGGDYSAPGGGDPQKQNWSENSDVVIADPLPDETHYGAQACGLVTVFTPSDSQLRYLSDVIWGNGFFQFMQNLVENISDLFISLGMVPFTVTKGATVEVTWFDFAISGQQVGTGIYLDKAASQFAEFDMGTIMLDGSDDRIFATDSVLDYSPYSRLGIYLPFIGYQELDIDECRGSSLNLKYRVDILSGTVVAQITINGRTIYQFTGDCLTQLPLTAMDAQGMISNAVNIGIAAASAGATGAVASAGDALTAENLANGDISAASAELQNAQHAAQVSNARGSLAAASANGMMGMKPNFKKSGAIGASASLISVMQPYLFLETPRQSMPDGYEKVCGFPCNIGGTLGDFSGFTVVEDIRLNGLVATSPEVEEIYQLLKSGVII